MSPAHGETPTRKRKAWSDGLHEIIGHYSICIELKDCTRAFEAGEDPLSFVRRWSLERCGRMHPIRYILEQRYGDAPGGDE